MTNDSSSALERLRARKADRDAAEQAASGENQATIVVVDDEKGNLDAVMRVLGSRYQVTVFEQAEEALAHVDEVGCADLYITDQRMPHMTGVEFLTMLVEKHPYATGIILSGYTERADLIGAINQAHVSAYVTKPWRPAVLLETIESALEVSATRKANAARNQRLSSLSSRLEQLDDNTDTDDFLAGFDDLESELDSFAE
jgi:two-component system response regulator HupR/HoxA